MFLVYLAIILGGIYLMHRIFSSGSSKSEFSGDIKEYSKYERGSIGHMLRNDAIAAERGDLDALLSTTGDREIAKRIIQWYEDKHNRMDYYAIKEPDAVGKEPNYAIVMTNDSGFYFKEFSCKARVGKKGGPLETVRCTARNWGINEEGKLWFYSSIPDVSYMNIDVRDIKYDIGKSVDPASITSKELEYMIITAELKESGEKINCYSMIPGIEAGDAIVINVDQAEQIAKVISVAQVKESDLKQPIREYHRVLRKMNGSSGVLDKYTTVKESLSEDEEIYEELVKLEEKMSKVLKKADEITYEDSDGKATHLASQIKGSYVPKTIETLKKYGEVLASGIPEESLGNIRADVLKAIDKSNEVYTNILISLYEQDITELSAEIESLQAMFAREGLLNSDFDIKA